MPLEVAMHICWSNPFTVVVRIMSWTWPLSINFELVTKPKDVFSGKNYARLTKPQL